MQKFCKGSILGVLSFLFVFGFTAAPALAAGPAPVVLGAAGSFEILAETAITTTGVTAITGDIGVSPAAASTITGFSQTLDGSGVFSTSALVSGKIYAADYSAPTPANLTVAVSAMQAAYTDAATRTPGAGATNLNVGSGTLSGQNFVPGTYTWGSNVDITGDITFTGTASDVWIIQISGTLALESGKKIVLAGGVLPSNIFWQVAGTTTVFPGAKFAGVILAGPGASTIAFQNGATLNGQALGQTDVTLIGNTFTSIPASIPVVIPSSPTDNNLGYPFGISELTPTVGDTVTISCSAGVSCDEGGIGSNELIQDATGNLVTVWGGYSTTFPFTIAGAYHIENPNVWGSSAEFNVIASSTSPLPLLANLDVIQLVINGTSSSVIPANFSVHVKSGGVDVLGSPTVGTAVPGTPYSLSAGSYTVSEAATSSYTLTFSGDCDANGNITLVAGANKVCTIISTNIPLPVGPIISIAPVVIQSSGGGGGGGGSISYTPVSQIHILDIPHPLALPGGSGLVIYNYTVSNIAGQEPLSDVSIIDNNCSPVTYVSGDTNNSQMLEPGTDWNYQCTATRATTTTDTVVATGYNNSNGFLNLPVIATAIANVVVGIPVTPSLVDLVEVPSRLTPFPFGGGNVTYTYIATNPGTVPLANISVTDNECTPVKFVSGDINGNHLLDSGESWIYTCNTNISVSKRSAAMVKADLNGSLTLGYAFANVLVAVPGLPNTGIAPTASTTIFSRSLSKGSTGPDVVLLQTSLETKGFLIVPSGVVLGFFGSLTQAAVSAYQTSEGLPSVGIFGPLTRARIISSVK